ncbi:bifunctional [glutamine synthetase] adenylyltransferase/[glutamine synthetase]-adenylyl-L-tyrosine phosphorylase, partial [uncultured Corynebacterium sp.]|uniref:bifunctional [glutamine synthetase] adenylyltransferase/[glutamine synthetase]-adenylyl-L-tyrosine phosphorylase n=1 Tax=uncultured Corynebacterium sp. TaxID=159447 RepID=UPI0025F4E70B
MISPAKLGLTSPRAAEDIEELSLIDEASLYTLAGASDPDLALNNAHRLFDALGDGWAELLEALRDYPVFRTRLFALLGGSTALSDHLIAHPQQWRLPLEDLPDQAELYRTMLAAVGVDADGPGLYKAGEGEVHVAKQKLRATHRDLVMRIAAADLAGTFAAVKGYGEGESMSYSYTTERLTWLADAALTAALAVAVRDVYGDEEADAELAVIAMGKCGAGELNYISDVDVVFVAEPASPKITRVAAEMMRIGSACFFDVDANLRPEGTSGALVRTLESHQAYYRKWAETWEFQALLKARPQTGTMELGRAYSEAIAPLVWEASQRDSFVEDVQAMRRRVLENVPAEVRRRELKLGPGGLRDVEFAVQLLQLVHGRIDDTLRARNTLDALSALAAAGYVGREDARVLTEAYEFLRLLEHRLQLQRFKRTHQLPESDDEKRNRWLARAAGFTANHRGTAPDAMYRELKRVRRDVSDLHERLFYRPLLGAVADMSVGEATLSADAVKAQLAALGYRHPARAFDHLSALVKGTSRKAKLQAILLPSLMHWLA